jgi:hypothetical protein
MALFYEIFNYICYEKTNFDSKYLFSFISYTYYRATYVQFWELLLDKPSLVQNQLKIK